MPCHLTSISAEGHRGPLDLGSYLVNVAGDCNGCTRIRPTKAYLPGGNPFQGQLQDRSGTYLVGGRTFIPAHLFSRHCSRNLRPERTACPEGHTYEDFLKIIRTGVDLDHAHPEYGPYLQ